MLIIVQSSLFCKGQGVLLYLSGCFGKLCKQTNPLLREYQMIFDFIVFSQRLFFLKGATQQLRFLETY
jgi:hypothetical protein